MSSDSWAFSKTSTLWRAETVVACVQTPRASWGPGHILLETRFGDFDCLGAIDGSRAYEDLLEGSVQVELDGRQLRVIGLGELLEIKKRAGRPKDLAGIPYIEATIAELSRQK